MSNQTIENMNTTILGFAESNYDHLSTLTGTENDLERIKQIFSGDSEISVYPENSVELFHNCTLSEVQNTIVNYVYERSARGDKIIFYFSGHGAVLGNGDLYLCTKDTRKGFGGNGFLPLSALSMREIIQTLSNADILPCFIIDACFSGTSININKINFGVTLEYLANQTLGNSYAILASSGSDSFSLGDSEGGYFTNAIFDISQSGLPNNIEDKFVTIQNITKPLNEILAVKGAPLSRLHIGKSFPNLPLCKNIYFEEKIRKERFIHSYKPIFEHIFRNGSPQPFSPSELRSKYPSAYGNSTKMIYIWGLLEKIHGDGNLRHLTQKGLLFVQNKISIPKVMILHPSTKDWIPAEDTKYIYYDEV
jgi:hypothetical protein